MEMFDLEKYLLNALKEFAYWLVSFVNSALDSVLSFFPSGEGLPHIPRVDSFNDEHHILSTLISTLSWLLPLQTIILCITTLSAFLFVYFLVSPVLRFFKIIR